MGKSINEWVYLCNGNSRKHGFWDGKTFDDSLPEKLMLIVSECAEVLEEHRRTELPSNIKGDKNLWFETCKIGNTIVIDEKPEGIVPELIDILIRTFDLLGETGYDIEEELQRKHNYNISRPTKHGKKY